MVVVDDDLSDENVIRNEWNFRRRFGYGFNWGRRHREALIRLKHEKDLTDSEIKLFRHTGNLRRTAFGVQLAASPWIAAYGGIQLLYFGALLVALILAGWHNLVSAPVQYLKAWLWLTGLLALCYMLYWAQIKPWLVQRRTERHRAA